MFGERLDAVALHWGYYREPLWPSFHEVKMHMQVKTLENVVSGQKKWPKSRTYNLAFHKFGIWPRWFIKMFRKLLSAFCENVRFCRVNCSMLGSHTFRDVSLNTAWKLLFGMKMLEGKNTSLFGSSKMSQVKKNTHMETLVLYKPILPWAFWLSNI